MANGQAIAGAIAASSAVVAVGGIRWLIRDTRARAFHDGAQGALARFEDLRVTSTQLLAGSHHAPRRYPLAGVHASVETAGQIQHRVTLTRVALAGVWALALQKRKDDRSVFLVIEGPGVAEVREVPVRGNPNIQVRARRFAAAVNAQALVAPTTPPAAAAVPDPEPEDEIPPGFQA